MTDAKKKLLVRRCMYAVIALMYVMLFALILRPKADNITDYVTYEVQYGDTLWTIAREVYGDECDIRPKIDRIRHINGIESGVIYAGQAISLPVSEVNK